MHNATGTFLKVSIFSDDIIGHIWKEKDESSNERHLSSATGEKVYISSPVTSHPVGGFTFILRFVTLGQNSSIT